MTVLDVSDPATLKSGCVSAHQKQQAESALKLHTAPLIPEAAQGSKNQSICASRLFQTLEGFEKVFVVRDA